MKINFGKLLALVGRIIVATPAIVAAVKPVIRPSDQPPTPKSAPVVPDGTGKG